jgi:putative PIN family toxin of toxin-antitoxin system
MSSALRIVVDTNVLVSALLAAASVPGRAVMRAADSGQLLASAATLAEIDEVLRRPRFARFLSLESRLEFLKRYRDSVRLVLVPAPIHICRDPSDDKFLEVAVYGKADLIVTGDADLLTLNPYQSVQIVTPQTFLASAARSLIEGDAK